MCMNNQQATQLIWFAADCPFYNNCQSASCWLTLRSCRYTLTLTLVTGSTTDATHPEQIRDLVLQHVPGAQMLRTAAAELVCSLRHLVVAPLLKLCY